MAFEKSDFRSKHYYARISGVEDVTTFRWIVGQHVRTVGDDNKAKLYRYSHEVYFDHNLWGFNTLFDALQSDTDGSSVGPLLGITVEMTTYGLQQLYYEDTSGRLVGIRCSRKKWRDILQGMLGAMLRRPEIAVRIVLK